MTSHALEASVQTEGSDDLKEFLMKYESDLKNSIYPIYSVLIKIGLDTVELLEFDVVDLRQTLEEEGLKKLHIGRLIKTLRKMPQSQIYVDTQTKPAAVVILSSEEEKALNDIISISKKIKKNVAAITDTVNTLNANYKSNEQVIHNEFDKIINIANKRRDELLQKLKTLKENKNDNLLAQIHSMKEFDAKLVKSYDESQKMIQNTTYDATKRKAKILTATSDLVKGAEKWIDFKVSATIIKIIINCKELMNKLTVLGDAEYVNVPNAPSIAVEDVKVTSVMINIKNQDDVSGHKLEYIEVNDEHDIYTDGKLDDDMKVDWNIVDIVGDMDTNYNLCGLKPETNYMIRGVSKNIYGFGHKSNILTFTTKLWCFDVITSGYDECIEDNGNIFNVNRFWSDEFITASHSEGYGTGTHEFKIKINSMDDHSSAFAVVSDYVHQSNKWIREHSGKYYYFNSFYGIIYAHNQEFEKLEKWKRNDIICMVLNCDDWTLHFKINEISTQKIYIEKNKTYYPCLCAGELVEYLNVEIVS